MYFGPMLPPAVGRMQFANKFKKMRIGKAIRNRINEFAVNSKRSVTAGLSKFKVVQDRSLIKTHRILVTSRKFEKEITIIYLLENMKMSPFLLCKEKCFFHCANEEK